MLAKDATWFVVDVEHPAIGIRAEHYRQEVFPASARDAEETAGLIVHSVRTWGPNKHWPNLPNYVGRPVCN